MLLMPGNYLVAIFWMISIAIMFFARVPYCYGIIKMCSYENVSLSRNWRVLRIIFSYVLLCLQLD